MKDYSLKHLKEHVTEISKSTKQVRPLLMMIKDELRPMVRDGIPIGYMMSQLQDIGVTSRTETLRRFLRTEFPQEYARFYKRNRQGTPSERHTYPSSLEAAPAPSEEAPSPTSDTQKTEEEPSPAQRKTQRINVFEALDTVESHSKGEHFKEDRKGE